MVDLSEDIRRVAESAAGQKFRVLNETRWTVRAKAAAERYEAKREKEQARFDARMKAIRAEWHAAQDAARVAHRDADARFFNKALAAFSKLGEA